MQVTNILAIFMASLAATQAGVVSFAQSATATTLQTHVLHGDSITPASTPTYVPSKDCTFQGQIQNYPLVHHNHQARADEEEARAIPPETMRPTIEHIDLAVSTATPSSTLVYKGSKDCTFQGQTQNCPAGHPAHVGVEEARANPPETMRPTIDRVPTVATPSSTHTYKGSKDCTFQGQDQNCPPGHPAHVDEEMVRADPAETTRPTIDHIDHTATAATPSSTLTYIGSKDCTFQGQTQNCPPGHPLHVDKEMVRADPAETMRPTIDHLDHTATAATPSSTLAYTGSKDCTFQGQTQNCPPGHETRAESVEKQARSDVSRNEIAQCFAQPWLIDPRACEAAIRRTNLFDVATKEEIARCYLSIFEPVSLCEAGENRLKELFLNCGDEGCGEPVIWEGNKAYRKWYAEYYHLHVPEDLLDVEY